MVKRRNKNTFTWPWQGEGWQAEHKGLMPFEWVVIAYIAFTLLIVLFTSTKLVNESRDDDLGANSRGSNHHCPMDCLSITAL